MKKYREIIIGLGILLVGFFVGICVAIFVVENNFHSNASNDGWLGFLGGLFGSFVSGMITFYVLYVNRKDMETDAIVRQRTSEMDRMEDNLRDAFSLLRIEQKLDTAESYFLIILNKIPEKYKEEKYYKLLYEVYMKCKDREIQMAISAEIQVYRKFIDYRRMYIEGR